MSVTVVEEKAEEKVPLAGELLYCGATEWDVIGRRKTGVLTENLESILDLFHRVVLDVYDGDVPATEGIEKDNGKGNRKKGSNDALANSSRGKKSEKSDSNSDGYEFEETNENAGNGLMRNKKGQVGRKTSGRGRGSRPNMSMSNEKKGTKHGRGGSTTKSGKRGRTRN